jgi:hypothetical protein
VALGTVVEGRRSLVLGRGGGAKRGVALRLRSGQSGMRFARLVYHTAEAVCLRDRRWPVERLRYRSEGVAGALLAV